MSSKLFQHKKINQLFFKNVRFTLKNAFSSDNFIIIKPISILSTFMSCWIFTITLKALSKKIDLPIQLKYMSLLQIHERFLREIDIVMNFLEQKHPLPFLKSLDTFFREATEKDYLPNIQRNLKSILLLVQKNFFTEQVIKIDGYLKNFKIENNCAWETIVNFIKNVIEDS